MTRAVRAPDRAAAAQASEPAWPPPMTTTSKGLSEWVLDDSHVGEGAGRPYLESCATVAKALIRPENCVLEAMGRPSSTAGLLKPRGVHAFFILGRRETLVRCRGPQARVDVILSAIRSLAPKLPRFDV